MQIAKLSELRSRVADIRPSCPVGRVNAVDGNVISVLGLEDNAKIGDRLKLLKDNGTALFGEVIKINRSGVTMLPDGLPDRVALSDRVISLGPCLIAPSEDWIGRVVDPMGQSMDGRHIAEGATRVAVSNDPPPPAFRKGMGDRLETGFHLFNTMLPIAKGQRIGIFAGSGVGKTTLLADFAKYMKADLVVLALVGERGREIRDFTKDVLGNDGMSRAIVVAAAADSSPTQRARCPQTALRTSEFFRDRGLHVLLIVDSMTRFAEAEREIAVMSGDLPSLRGFPASTPSKITHLAERAGPGAIGVGDITAIFSVLVAGSDLNEPVSDMIRGVLDGHIVLSRQLAERGIFPSVDVLSSVSRSLPNAANKIENELITRARVMESEYQDSSELIRSGLYSIGDDEKIDAAITFHKTFEVFSKAKTRATCSDSFDALGMCFRNVSVNK